MSTAGVVDAGHELRCINCNKLGWCPHIKEYIEAEEDRNMMHPEMLVFLPLFPSFDLYTLIVIAEETYPGVALMEIEHTPDIGNQRRVALGFWNTGESRVSMRRVVIDWIKGKVPTRGALECPSTTHKFKQINELAFMLDDKPATLWPNAWACLMEGACLPCIALSADPDNDVPDVGNAAPWQGNN